MSNFVYYLQNNIVVDNENMLRIKYELKREHNLRAMILNR